MVSQHYKFTSYDIGDDIKTNIILSDYDDLGIAKGHARTLLKDKFATVIDLLNKSHVARLNQILLPSSDYRIYWSSLYNRQDLKRKLDAQYSSAIDYYLKHHIEWAEEGDKKYYKDIQLINGELFITVTLKAQSINIKFRDIAELM
ncbi:MAG: hypothetical protein ABIR81_11350 [Ginsengibacter sp.]